MELTAQITVPGLFIATVTACATFVCDGEQDVMVLARMNGMAKTRCTLNTGIIKGAIMASENRLALAEHMPTGHAPPVLGVLGQRWNRASNLTCLRDCFSALLRH